ncbi:hypothetical protein WG66_000520, partial [Moniliophthora roreri]
PSFPPTPTSAADRTSNILVEWRALNSVGSCINDDGLTTLQASSFTSQLIDIEPCKDWLRVWVKAPWKIDTMIIERLREVYSRRSVSF